MNGPTLARLRRSLSRHAKDGWVRCVFAKPGQDDQGAIVHDGPGTGVATSPEAMKALLAAAEAAAEEGHVKHTLVLDDSTRVRIDARYGKAKILQLDAQTATKVMGGKERSLRPDTSGPLLRAIGIMNADGSISAKNAKKYKQVSHLVELCRPAWERVASHRTIDDTHPLRVLDLGCGNSYLTFVLAEALRLAEIPSRLHGIDARHDVIERSQERATQLKMDNVRFTVSTIAEADLGDSASKEDVPPDLVLALHACDTATDEAIDRAVRAGANEIFLAPCCQREVASQLEHSPVRALVRQGLLKREYAATLTDALRVEMLEACGYIVDTVEFVGSSHTPKNLLIRAHRRWPGTPVLREKWQLQRVADTCESLGARPTALGLLLQAAG